MEGWTVERVQQLAPDAASAKAGQGLAGARHWVSSGMDGSALWGECKGSGAKPYQVRVDLTEPAFKCSCPSRKFPCKHALGLMLMHAGGSLSPAERPAWVLEWFAERSTRAEKKREKAESPPKPVDAVAQQKRRENRLQRIGEGLNALKLWLIDLARTGLAAAPSRDYAFFDDMARRLIDAQAPGAARKVQSLAGIAASGAGWQQPFLEQLSLLYLLACGFERRETVPESVRDVLLNAIGVPRPQEEILAIPPLSGRWQIIAQQITQEDRLLAQHTWLLSDKGLITRVLSFAHGNQPLDTSFMPGFAFDGEVCLYPGDALRGLVKTRSDLAPIQKLASAMDIQGLLDRYASERAANPWLEGLAVPLAEMTPMLVEGQWLLRDVGGHALPMVAGEQVGWTLLALSGGDPVDVVAHFDGRRARPLAALVQGEYIRLAREVSVEAAA